MLAIVPPLAGGDSVFDIGSRLTLLLKDAEAESVGGQLNEPT